MEVDDSMIRGCSSLPSLSPGRVKANKLSGWCEARVYLACVLNYKSPNTAAHQLDN